LLKAAITLCLLAVLAVACGEPAPTSPGARGAAGGGAAGTCLVGTTDCDDTPDTPVSSGPGGGSYDEGRPQRVKPQPGMADTHILSWEKATPKGKRHVIVEFWSGVEPCYVLDHVDVDYGPKKVTITVWEGNDPLDEDEGCIEIAVLKSTKVKLSEPLGDRTIVDGAE
jgi:hypothetical protein